MFTESFNEVENFTITKLPLGGSKITVTAQRIWKNTKKKNAPIGI